jgi:hypothetical protein
MKRPRKVANLSKSLSHKLNMYALAASAAGVGVLALVQPLEAEIVYTKAYRHIPPNTAVNLDLNHDGITDFSIANVFRQIGDWKLGVVYAGVRGNNGVRGYVNNSGRGSGTYASALAPRVEVRSGNFIARSKVEMVSSKENTFTGSRGAEGQWLDIKGARYLGLAFAILGETHYGWARLELRCKHENCHILLTGYAYESLANTGIVTGKIHGPDVITVQPGSLGHLAHGASAIPAWRKAEGNQ